MTAKTIKLLGMTLALSTALGSGAFAQDAACDTVTLSDVGWTDITTTTATARHVLEGLGYDVDVKVLSVPVTFASLESDDVDIFLGNWMPSQQAAIQPYLDSGEIESVAVNLDGTKYNLAVPTYLYDEGLKTYADLAKFKDQLDSKIYGIEPGNEANTFLVAEAEKGAEGLGGFQVVESSEQGMLAMVGRAYKSQDPIVFLGWAPHPMNANYDIQYLKGGEAFFGGEGQVHTVTRKGYVEECPNVGQLLKNMKFSLDMENKIMGQILDEGEEAGDATEAWLKANPGEWEGWLEGVTTVDGKPGLPAVKESLGL